MSAHWLPKLDSITVHPGERWSLDQQLPTARVFGEPIPADVAILESHCVTFGTIRLRFGDGSDVTCTLSLPTQPQRWIRCDRATGTPLGRPPSFA